MVRYNYYGTDAKELGETLSAEEIQALIDGLSDEDKFIEMAEFEDNRMTPKQMRAWAAFADEFPGAVIQGNSIQRPRTQIELSQKALEKEAYRIKYEKD